MSESNTSAAIMSVCRFYTFLHPAQHGFNCQKITQQVAQRPSLQLRREVYHEQQQHTSIEGHCNDPQWLCLAASSGSPPGSSGKFWARHSRNRRHQMATAAWEGRVIEVFVEFKGHVLVRELCQSDTGWEVLLKDLKVEARCKSLGLQRQSPCLTSTHFLSPPWISQLRRVMRSALSHAMVDVQWFPCPIPHPRPILPCIGSLTGMPARTWRSNISPKCSPSCRKTWTVLNVVTHHSGIGSCTPNYPSDPVQSSSKVFCSTESMEDINIQLNI